MKTFPLTNRGLTLTAIVTLALLTALAVLVAGASAVSAQGTVPDVPDRPTGTAIFVGGVDLEWNDVPGADSYDVQMYRKGGWTDLPGDSIDVAFYGAGAIVSELDPDGASYYFRVRSKNAYGSSEWSDYNFMATTNESKQGRRARPDNVPADGAPVIERTAQVGESLAADTSGIEDGNGLDRVQFRFQWVSHDGSADTDIANATDSIYTVAATDVGNTIKVRVAFTDRGGYAESLTGGETTTVAAGSNSPATGQPTIAGTAQVGEALTADTSSIADADGLTNASYSYQWIANDGTADTEITGATDYTYTLVDADEGWTIKVQVSFTDDAGNEESLTSAATEEVEARPNTPATGVPAINGTAQVGEMLTVDTSGIADADGLNNVAYSYQWLADDADIAGATAQTYTLVDADGGAAVKVRVSFTDDTGNQEMLTSAATGTVEARPNSPATGQPTISGTVQVGETLTADTSGISDADGLSNVAYSYQWLADGADIAGATATTYTLTDADEGAAVKVRVSFTDDTANDEELTSAATDAVEARPNSPATGQPTISGTAQVGETLTADTSGISDADGLTNVAYSYQWLADDADIAGATAQTYTLVDADEGATIKVRVFFKDDAANDEELTSAATEEVDFVVQQQVANTPASGAPVIAGTVRAGETLTVDTSDISDGDGLVNVTFGYQWISNYGTRDTDIADETSSTYVTRPWDLGKYIKARVSFTDDAGNKETLTSAPTFGVEASPNHPAEGWLNLHGMAEVGQDLRVVEVGLGPGWAIQDANGLVYATFSFQWIRSDGTADVEIPGATGQSYTLVDADEGGSIKVRVSFTDDGANPETLTSSATSAVTARPHSSGLSAPSALSVNWSRGEEKGNALEWVAPEGTVTGYQILRLEIPTRSSWWEPYSYGCTPLMEVHVSDTGGNATTFTDTDVAEGASYIYSVRAINSDGIGRKSSSSTTLQYRPPHVFLPNGGPIGSYWPNGVPGSPYQVPTNLASIQIKNGIGLTWEAPESTWAGPQVAVTGYQILRRSPEQCDFGYRVYVENTNSTDTHWADRDVVSGTRYEYHVRAVNDVGAGRLDRSISTSLRPTTLVVGPGPNNPATGTPTITGTAQVGETLTADPSGIADADGMHWASLSYQWLSSQDTEIQGATSSTYTLKASDANKAIRVRIDFTDDAGYEESLNSEATGAVKSNAPAIGVPTITGPVGVGETPNVDTSGIEDEDGLDNVSFSYQWVRTDGTADLDIDGATAATYTITATDVGHALKVRVRFTDDEGNMESLTSAVTVTVPIEVTLTFNIEGTTVTCGSYNVHAVNVPIVECDDPISTVQGANGEIDVEIEVARSVNSQLYKFDFGIYEVEDSLGNIGGGRVNDLCLGPGLADSASIEATPDDGTGPLTYTDDGTIFELCPSGTYQLIVNWYRYNEEDQEYEYAGTFRRYFFITSNGEVDTSIEKVKSIVPLYPDPPISHGDVQIEATKEPEVLNRELVTYSLSIRGLVPDSDPETTDYVVRLQVIGSDSEGERRAVPSCHVGNVGYSYQLKTVAEDGVWAMQAHLKGSCLTHWFPDTLRIELFDGTDLTDYSEPIVFGGSLIISHTGELQYPEYGTHEFIAGEDIALDALPNSPATGAPTISGTAQIGSTLTADTSGIADADGMTGATFTYQWVANDGTADSDIASATGSTYTLAAANEGKTIKVRVSFTDDAGNEEELTSAATDTVEARPNSPATGLPTISGTARVGETLTADTSGIADADGLTNATFTYQWLADDSDISGATNATYTLTDSEESKAITVQVSFTDDADNEETLTSAATDAVAGAQPTEPPAKPRNLSATASHDSVTLTWDDPGDDSITGYVILRRNRATTAPGEFTELVDDTGSAATTYTDGSVSAETLYTYRIKAINDHGLSELSRWVRADTPSPPVPAKPTGLTAASSHDQVVLSWDDPQDDTITGYVILRRNRATTAPGEFTELVADTGSAANTYTDDSVAADTSYTYKIRAINEHGVSELSRWARADTPAPSPANSPATGAPTIAGTAQVGETLTADTSGIADGDGLTNVAYSYQWLADDADIAGATDSSYTLVDADEGAIIKLRVSFTDDAGNEETMTSAATEPVGFAVQQQIVNTPATGQPTISGMAQVGETLTADTSGISDVDGLSSVSYSYQWLADGAEIAGATATVYTLTDSEEGKTVKVRVSFTDDAGNEEELTSAATGMVEARPNSPATGQPTISGTAQVGETLTADTLGISDQDGLSSASYNYQWLADDGNSVTGIAGATDSTYTVAAVDEGSTIQVMVSFTDDAGNDEELTSAATDTVEARPNSPATGWPTITGTAQVGETLTADTSGIADQDGLTNVAYSYQWLADDADIAGATDSSYTPTDGDEGAIIKLRVSFTDDAGNEETMTSAATDAVAAVQQQIVNTPATGQPTISGMAQVGETLTADTSGISDVDGLSSVSYSYQWLADDADIAGATATTYTLTDSEQGKTVKVRVSFTDDAGNDESLTSAATGTVEARPNSPATGAPVIVGTARVGETLTADTSGIADADGLSGAVYRYEWIVSDGGADLVVPGAKASTYTVLAIDRMLVIKVRVHVTDDRGHVETLTSAPTAVVR